jgi:CHAT domain-containing protein
VLPPIDSLVAPIDRFVAQLESGTDAGPLARTLGDAVLGPALGELDPATTQLVVVADGALHRLPFDALRLADGRAAVERYTVGHAPSAAVFAEYRRRPAESKAGPRSAPRVLAFGDPVFDGEAGVATGEAAVTLRSAFAGREGLGRLPASGGEAREAARYGRGSVVRLRGEASEAWLKGAALGGFSVIHFATHALVDDASVERTALALAPGAGEDGFVAPADLAALELDADLVVLSACRTAGGVVVAGEGVQGLAAPLLAAGARSVVATQWRVGDRSTARFVEDLYAALAHGRPVAEALREAKRAAARRGAPAGEWAGFTVVGDPLATVALAAPAAGASPWRWAALGGGVLAVAGIGATMAVRRREG